MLKESRRPFSQPMNGNMNELNTRNSYMSQQSVYLNHRGHRSTASSVSFSSFNDTSISRYNAFSNQSRVSVYSSKHYPMHLPSPQEEAPQIHAIVKSSNRPEDASSVHSGRQSRSRSNSVSKGASSYGAYRASGSQYDVSRVLDSPIDEEFSAQIVASPTSILQGDYFVRKSAFLRNTPSSSSSSTDQATLETAFSLPTDTSAAPVIIRRQTLRERRVTGSPPKDSQFHFRSNSDVGLSRIPSLSNSVRSVKSYSLMSTTALLSSIAEAFKEQISLKDNTKDSLEYKESFTGQEAIDVLCKVIPTKDRGLALNVGRGLESQKLFHDVTYERRLKDSPDELYVFRELPATFDDSSSVRTDSSTLREKHEVNGVFTQLTACYSPTCSPEKLCYCSFCPQRMEQQARINTLNNLERSDSRTSTQEKQKRQELWIESVPKEISDSLSKSERKRQEILFELIYTEKDFVNDLELLQELYIKPLRYGSYIEAFAREPFIRDVFYNINEIHNVSAKLGRALSERQDEQPVIDQIGDIFLNYVKSLKPFVIYGGHQVYSKHRLEVEVKRNPKLSKFLEERERLPELRKLPIHSYLARPTTRLGRYPLLLEGVMKSSPEGHPDNENLAAAINVIKECLSQINAESGKADNRLRLTKLNDSLVCKDGESKDLRLLDESRQLIRDGVIKKRSGVEQVELTMFLFDHMLLLTKKKKTRDGDRYEYRVHKKPIPLELLSFSSRDESIQKSATRRSSSSFLGKSTSGITTPKYIPDLNKGGYPLVITHLGRNGMSLTLYAANQADRKEWEEKIEQQRDLITRKNGIFEMEQLSDNATFGVTYRITCSTTYWYGQKVVIGTEDGIYIGANGTKQRFRKVIDIEKVSQIAILEDFNLLLILSDKTLVSYPLEALDSSEMVSAKRARKVTSHVSFFEVGVCVEKTLVCVVKSTAFSSTVKTYEPIQASVKPKKNSLGRLLIRNGIDGMKIYKEFYIPTESSSVHFLKSKLCVGCAKGFEVVDLATLSTQCLLDPFDENLNFVTKKENAHPIDIFRLKDGDFLLCYDEFAFYVNKNGRRAKPSWLINWEGNPASFALQYPYVLAFDPTFIEVRHVETGNLEQVIPCRDLRTLNVDSNTIHCVMNTFMDYQCVFKINFTKEAAPPPTPLESNNSQLERKASNPARYCYS